MASYSVSLSCSKSWRGYVTVYTTDDSANNRTYIECELYAYKTDGYSSGSSGACFQPSITIDGETFWGTSYTTEYTSENWHASASKWVYHNSSTGAKTVTISGSITKVSGSPSTKLDGTTLSGSKSITLTTYNVVQTYSIDYYPGNYGSPGNAYTSKKTQGQNLTLSGALYTRTGYTQTGWASDPAGTIWAYALYGTYTYDSDAYLYPYWSADGYTIYYYPGTYGTGSSTTQDKPYNTNITLYGALYTRTGYTQGGWASNAAGTNLLYSLQSSYSDNNNAYLYPYWIPNVYTLTINPNGGSMRNGNSFTANSFTTHFAYGIKTYIGNLISEGTYYPDNAPTRTGYQFNGFTFTAGSGQKNTAGETFYFNGDYPDIADSLASSTNTWIFNGNATSNVTATAQWTGNTYYVQYNANGGTGTMSNSTHVYGTNKNLTANSFIRTNYTFTGWNTKADGSGTAYTNSQTVSTLTDTAGATVQLYAQWSQSSYSVIFDMNGGTATSGNFSQMTCLRGTSYTIPAGTMVRSGYDFLGWNTSSSATSASYAAGGTFSDLGSSGSTVTLYAIWKAKSIKIKYNANNGTTNSSTSTYNATSVSNTMMTPTWTYSGYVAVGWARSSTATTPDYYFGQSFSGDLGVADGATLNLYVVWTQQQPWRLAVMDIYRSKNFVTF